MLSSMQAMMPEADNSAVSDTSVAAPSCVRFASARNNEQPESTNWPKMNATPVTTASSTPDQLSRQGHTRTYQACLQCRSRKVKCDLGAVDDPGDPPCKRCRREGKECTFSKTRRKRKGEGDDGAGSTEPEDAGTSTYGGDSTRKRQRGDSGSHTPSEHGMRGYNNGIFGHSSSPPRSAGIMSRPLRRPDVKRPIVNDEEDQKRNENTAAMLQRAEILGGHDALSLLYEATLRNGDIKQDPSEHSAGPGRKSVTNIASPQPVRANGTVKTPEMTANHVQNSQAPGSISPTTSSQDRADAIDAWSKFRFVRAGWFTASEAIEYIDYFYKFLLPLSPITIPDFQNPKTHPKLLADEPMLTVTILTIVSRYVKFQGPGGISRPYAIHSNLWTYLQGLIDRMIWGQEQFGGGFCGAGSRSGHGDGTRKGLRTLGSIESLLLLTEWHTRALHFPPGEDNDELMLPDPEPRKTTTRPSSSRGTPIPSYESRPPHSASSRMDSWLEPCWRSDRMSWSLLANAMALAFEVEIFTPESERSQNTSRSSDAETIRIVNRRRANIKKLLFVYMELTSGRLGLKSMLHDRDPALYVGPNPLGRDGIAGNDQGLNNLLKSRDPNDIVRRKELQQDVVLYFWCKIAVIFQWGNITLFPSIAYTKELIKSGKYAELLIQARTMLLAWKSEFDQCGKFVPEHLCHILLIEYEYCRVYINIIALQAVVERCINSTPSKSFADMASNDKKPANQQTQVIPARALMKFYGNDRIHIIETTKACRNLLSSIIQGLRPGDYLKHAPVRTYFRIIAVSMVLLKTFVVGTSIDDAAQSFTYMQQASEAIEQCVVDDVHVGNHIGVMLGNLTVRVKSHLIRVQSQGESSRDSRASSQSPAIGVSNSTRAQQIPAIGQDATQRQFPMTSPSQNNFGQYPTLSAFYNQPGLYQAAQQDLYEIQSNIYDPNNPQTMIMPPPWSTMSPGSSLDADGNIVSPHGLPNQADLGYPPNASLSDWVGLPLLPLVTGLQGEVGQNGYGPDIGGDDMLEPWLLPDDFTAQFEPQII